jgi:hypothetical protein
MHIGPSPDEYDDGEIGGMIWQWKPKYSEKNFPSAAFPTTNLTCCPDANPGRDGGKPATNRLSYGTALADIYLYCYSKTHVFF